MGEEEGLNEAEIHSSYQDLCTLQTEAVSPNQI